MNEIELASQGLKAASSGRQSRELVTPVILAPTAIARVRGHHGDAGSPGGGDEGSAYPSETAENDALQGC
ncbi:MAG: hypothetical protein JOZ39_03160 [Chloroflexi bacterium]|nr:hypothetical protein [Chloroflexota bacterium]